MTGEKPVRRSLWAFERAFRPYGYMDFLDISSRNLAGSLAKKPIFLPGFPHRPPQSPCHPVAKQAAEQGSADLQDQPQGIGQARRACEYAGFGPERQPYRDEGEHQVVPGAADPAGR